MVGGRGEGLAAGLQQSLARHCLPGLQTSQGLSTGSVRKLSKAVSAAPARICTLPLLLTKLRIPVRQGLGQKKKASSSL